MTLETPTVAAHPSRQGRTVVLIFGLFVLMFFALLVALRSTVQVAPRSLPQLGTLPDVGLTTQGGDTLRTSTLRGKLLIVDLQPAGCGAPCTERNHQMTEIQRWNASISNDVEQLTVLEVPATHELAAQQARELAARPQWRWFVADSPAFVALQQSLLPTPEADLALIDRTGQLRNRYLTTNKEHRRELMLDSRALLLEKVPTSP